MRNMQWQLGTWGASEDLLQGRGKSRKLVLRWAVAGPRLLATSPANKDGNPPVVCEAALQIL